MPRLSAWFIKAALVYLALGFTFGALMLANKGVPFANWAWALLPAHMEFLLIGWMAQLALGMAYWIFPRFSGGSRGNSVWAWAAFGLLNLGVWTVALQTVLGLDRWIFLAGRLAELGAGLAYGMHAWRRIRATYP